MHAPKIYFPYRPKKKSDRELSINFNWLWEFRLFLFFQKINMHAKKVSESLLFLRINRELKTIENGIKKMHKKSKRLGTMAIPRRRAR